MLELKIGNKIYKIEYSIEASLYNECTEKVTGLISELATTNEKDAIKKIISAMADVPQVALTMFYAGLMEHHGIEGDRTVLDISIAKKLIKSYINENKENENGNFYAIMGMLLEQMGNDGFFKMIGLEQMMETMTIPLSEPTKKVPQDHKKKVTEK